MEKYLVGTCAFCKCEIYYDLDSEEVIYTTTSDCLCILDCEVEEIIDEENIVSVNA